MVPNKKGIVGCEQALVENSEWSFKLRRTRRDEYEGSFLGKGYQLSLTIGKRQRQSFGSRRLAKWSCENSTKSNHAGLLKKTPTTPVCGLACASVSHEKILSVVVRRRKLVLLS